jgi:hypothetical protein
MNVLVNPALREELSTRFLGADFKSYFDFIESRPLRNKEGSERHHVLPQKEFPHHKKNLNNLMYLSPEDHLRAHYYLALCVPECLSFQRTFFLMSNTRKPLNLLTPEEISACADVYEKGREAQRVAVRPFGIMYGAKNVENGHLARIRPDPEVNRIQGRKNVENGHLTRIRTREVCVKGGLAGGKAAFASGALARNSALAGQKNLESGWAAELGRRAVESGQLRNVTTPESCAKGGRIGGIIAGQIAIQSGRLMQMCVLGGRKHIGTGHLNKIGRRGVHVRWHTNRDVVNPNCNLCQQATKDTDA